MIHFLVALIFSFSSPPVPTRYLDFVSDGKFVWAINGDRSLDKIDLATGLVSAVPLDASISVKAVALDKQGIVTIVADGNKTGKLKDVDWSFRMTDMTGVTAIFYTSRNAEYLLTDNGI